MVTTAAAAKQNETPSTKHALRQRKVLVLYNSGVRKVFFYLPRSLRSHFFIATSFCFFISIFSSLFECLMASMNIRRT